MEKRIQYTTVERREIIIQENSSLHLIEEQNILEGNFLIFSDVPRPLEPIYIDVSKNELNVLQEQIADLNQAMAFLIGGGV